MYRHFFKRFFDIVLSFCALVVLSPVLLVLAILVRLKLGRPVVFRQERPGKDEKIFQLCKFRSMTDQRDGNGKLLPDEVRLTKFGKALRSTSLDELPELWNILKGDMSIVGPRPLLVKYLPYYTEEELKRHDVRPGLTGLAQVNGRNFITWEETFAYDVEYVQNVTLLEDLKIIFQTVVKVLRRAYIADITGGEYLKNGQLLVHEGNTMRKMHGPLDVERREHAYAAGNRQ